MQRRAALATAGAGRRRARRPTRRERQRGGSAARSARLEGKQAQRRLRPPRRLCRRTKASAQMTSRAASSGSSRPSSPVEEEPVAWPSTSPRPEEPLGCRAGARPRLLWGTPFGGFFRLRCAAAGLGRPPRVGVVRRRFAGRLGSGFRVARRWPARAPRGRGDDLGHFGPATFLELLRLVRAEHGCRRAPCRGRPPCRRPSGHRRSGSPRCTASPPSSPAGRRVRRPPSRAGRGPRSRPRTTRARSSAFRSSIR